MTVEHRSLNYRRRTAMLGFGSSVIGRIIVLRMFLCKILLDN